MRDVEKRHADFTLDTPQLCLHGLPQLPVQGPQGFVQEEHVRPQHQRARQRDALLLPTTELLRATRLQTT